MNSARNSFYADPSRAFAAGSTALYTGHLIDEKGAIIAGSQLDTLTLSIVDSADGSIINSVSQTDILNTNRGTVDESGLLTVALTTEDTALVSGVKQAMRSLILEFTYGVDRKGRHQFDFRVFKLIGDPA